MTAISGALDEPIMTMPHYLQAGSTQEGGTGGNSQSVSYYYRMKDQLRIPQVPLVVNQMHCKYVPMRFIVNKYNKYVGFVGKMIRFA